MGEASKSARVILMGLFFIIFLIAAIVTLLLLIHKYDRAGTPDTDHERHLDSEELHRIVREALPMDIYPLQYLLELDMTPTWQNEDSVFKGAIRIVIETHNRSIKWITIHSKNLDVSDVKLFNYTGNQKEKSFTTTASPSLNKNLDEDDVKKLSLARWFMYPPTDRMVIETLEELPKNSLVLMEMKFVGEISTREKNRKSGLMKISTGDKMALVTSGVKYSGEGCSRQIFPCFDDTRFLSLFSTSVRRNSSHMVLSNTIHTKSLSLSDHSVTDIFSSTLPTPTRDFSLAVIPSNTPSHVGDGEMIKRIFTLNGATSPHLDIVNNTFKDIKKLVGESSKGVQQDILIFANESGNPDLRSFGLLSVSTPISGIKIFDAWTDGILRIKEPNDTWLEDASEVLITGNPVMNEMEDEIDARMEDFGDRPLGWNNLRFNEKDKLFLVHKSQKVLSIPLKAIEKKNFLTAVTVVLNRRIDENRNYWNNPNYEEEIMSLSHEEWNDVRRRELFMKYNKGRPTFANSTTLEELVVEFEKFENEPKKIRKLLGPWLNDPSYPLLTVEFLSPSKSMKISQSSFERQKYNVKHQSHQIWQFPVLLKAHKGSRSYYHWMNSLDISVPDVEIDELVVVNALGELYTRVNYQDDYWTKIFLKFHIFEKPLQDLLIDDLFTLTRAGYLKYNLTLNLLKHLKIYEDWIAANAIERKIRQIDFALHDTEIWEDWKKYVQKLVGSFYEYHAVKPIRGGMDGITRLACLHEYQPCLRNARHLHDFGDKPLSQDEALKEFSLFKFGTKAFKADNLHLEAALVANRVDLLDTYLRKIVEGQYERKSFVSLYSEVSKYFSIYRELWAWFRKNIRELQKIFSEDDVAILFERSAENFYSERDIQDANYVWRSGGILIDEVAYTRLHHKFSENSQWMETDYRTFQQMQRETDIFTA